MAYTRREAIRLGTAAMAAAAVPRTFGAPAIVKRRAPNILMLVADDLRHDALRCMGDNVVQTPHLDRFAAQGAAFSQAHQMGGKCSPVCVPTRGSLMTGCTVFRAMVDPANNIINPDRVTLGQHLRSQGYDAHIVGKWHNDFASLNRTFGTGEAIFLRGLNPDQYRMRVHHYDPSAKYSSHTSYHAKKFSTDFLADHAIDYLSRPRGDAPFFLYTAFTAPHDPRTPPPEFARLYDASRIPLPPNFALEHPFDNGALHERDEDLAPHPRTPQRTREEIASYYGMISSLDAGIGRILAALEASGQAENTLVVFTADHGLAVGQHGLMGKQNLYDHSTRVPLLLRGPGVPAGVRSDALAYAWDIVPTLCGLAGQAIPSGLDAQSLEPILRGKTGGHRSSIRSLYRDTQRMAKDDRWKLIEYTVGAERRAQLFDLRNDPWEMHNLAADSAASQPLAALRPRLLPTKLAA